MDYSNDWMRVTPCPGPPGLRTKANNTKTKSIKKAKSKKSN